MLAHCICPGWGCWLMQAASAAVLCPTISLRSNPERRTPFATAVRWQEQGGKKQTDSRCHSPVCFSSPSLPSSPRLLSCWIPGGVQLPLQSSQPLLTHCALAGWSILASCSASSAEQGSNWNSSSNGGPCSKMDRHKYTHLWEQHEAAAEGIPCSQELDYEMILFFNVREQWVKPVRRENLSCSSPITAVGWRTPLICKGSAS